MQGIDHEKERRGSVWYKKDPHNYYGEETSSSLRIRRIENCSCVPIQWNKRVKVNAP